MTTPALHQKNVAEAKAALRECALRADHSALAAVGPFIKHAAMAGGVLALFSVAFGKTRSFKSLLATGIRMVPTILKLL